MVRLLLQGHPPRELFLADRDFVPQALSIFRLRPREHKDPAVWFKAQDKGNSRYHGSLGSPHVDDTHMRPQGVDMTLSYKQFLLRPKSPEEIREFSSEVPSFIRDRRRTPRTRRQEEISSIPVARRQKEAWICLI